MKKLIKKLEDIMVAITFAEAGEYDEGIQHPGDSLENNTSRPVPDFNETALQNAEK